MGLKESVKRYIPKPVKTAVRKTKKFLHKEKYVLYAKLHPSEVTYYCPCCNVRLRSFTAGNFIALPHIYNPERYKNIGQEVQCPVCGTIPRHRILATWFSEHKDELETKKILYFACENGIKLWFKRNNIQYTTADLYAKADLKLDIENTGQPDSSWDWIVCNHVLEHVTDYKKALKELYRILKPGGKLICSFPILENMPTLIEETEHTEAAKAQRLKRFGQADHLRVFGSDSEEILKNAGFSVSRIDGNTMPDSILPVVGPADYDVNFLFLCQKPT